MPRPDLKKEVARCPRAAKSSGKFAKRFSASEPFRPVNIRGLFVDGDTVIVIWDGAGTTVAGTTYENTYAWIMTLNNGQVVEATAFYDSISFNELWKSIP